MNGSLTWYLARSSGIVAVALVTASVVLGLLMSTRLMTRWVPAREVAGAHRFLSLLAVAFTAVHGAAILLDGYVDFGLADVLVPFASSYDTVAVAWGVIAAWLLAAVVGTSLLRRHVGPRAWRAVHMATFALFWAAAVHGLTAGTDAGHPAFAWGAIGSIALVSGLTLVRVYRAAQRDARRSAPSRLPAAGAR